MLIKTIKSIWQIRPQEIVITLFTLFASLVFLIMVHFGNSQFEWRGLLEKFSFAALVAIAVRWLAILFEENKTIEDKYKSSDIELYQHLDSARKRIWICQTWLPGIAKDAEKILARKVKDTKILLASFKTGSPIYPRVEGRTDVNIPRAKHNSASSVSDFVHQGKGHCIRFYTIHHPGWIAVIDDTVFWGATPVDKDNWSVPFLFHKADEDDTRAKFWISQFKLLWKHKDSHDLAAECDYNEELPKYSQK